MRLGGILTDPPCKCNMRSHKPFIGLRMLEPQIMASGASERASKRASDRPRVRGKSARLNAPSRRVDRSINVKWPSNGLATQRGLHGREFVSVDSCALRSVLLARPICGKFRLPMIFQRMPLIRAITRESARTQLTRSKRNNIKPYIRSK